MSSHKVCVTPEFKDMPDIEKLGRVLIAIAINNAQDNEYATKTDTLSQNFATGEESGDVMT